MMKNDSPAKTAPTIQTMTFWNLKEEWRTALTKAYGPQPEPGKNKYSAHPIERIETLNVREQGIFDGQNFISTSFTVQLLYKVKGEIVPGEFNRAFEEVARRTPELRSNFRTLDDTVMKIILQDPLMPEIVYRNIEHLSGPSLDKAMKKAMDDDKRHSFDPGSDPLLRITVIHTGSSEYAVLLTQSILIAGTWSMHEVIAKALKARSLSPENTAGVRLAEPEHELSGTTRAYWQSILKDLPPIPALRGYKPVGKRITPMRHRLEIGFRDWKLLQEKVNDNKHMIIAVLHTAWGLLLQYMSGFPGTYYCLLMPDHCARTRNATATAGVVNSLIIRMACKEQQTMHAIMGQQFRQMLASTSFNCTRMLDLRRDYRDLFTHFLSFHDFSLDPKSYAAAEGTADGRVVDLHSWDVQCMDLGVYFYFEETALSVVFFYNQNNFAFHAVDRLAKYYETVLHTFLVYWDEPFSRFEAKLNQYLSDVRGSKQDADSQQRALFDFLAGQELFQALPESARDQLQTAIQKKNFSEYDIIPETADALLILQEGSVARCVDHGSSVTPMDVMREGAWLNENVLAPEKNARLLLQVVSEKAQVISVPLSILSSEDAFYQSLAAQARRSVEQYPTPFLYAAL